MEISQEHAEVAGLEVHWRRAGDAPVLYLHGVPTGSFDWISFLERIGGVAPDLPGFGRSAKPANFDYSIAGYDRFLEAFTAETGRERLAHPGNRRAHDGLHDPPGAAPRAPARAGRPRLGALRPGHPAGDPEAL